MKFKKIYIEITNSCNYHCSFCFKTSRAREFMSVDDFKVIVDKIRLFTNYIYLHVLGEPLLHPQLNEILEVATQAGLNINITTNGGLLSQRGALLISHKVRQVNVSLHDAEENVNPEKWDEYMDTVLDFAVEAASNTYISLRLWNSTNTSSANFNAFCLNKIADKFNLNTDLFTSNTPGNGVKISDHIFLQHAPRFEWPKEHKMGTNTHRNCYALRDHIAILAGGEVVPCCLDADAAMLLGNIFTDDLNDILSSDKAQNIKKGFERRRIVEPICASCGFVVD